ncbi:MAG: YcaO-like family protein [Bdellovibrionales bacterium]
MNSNIRIEHFADRIVSGLHHSDVYFNSDLGEIRGSGSGLSKERAIFIAFQEMRERYAFRKKITSTPFTSIKSSSGFASGLTAEDSARRALFELLERDAFLRHWYTKRPPHWVAAPHEIKKKFSNHGFDVLYAQLALYEECCVGLMAFKPLNPKELNFGFGIAIAASQSWSEHYDSLMFNISRLAHILLLRKELNDSLFIEVPQIKEPQDHYELYFQPQTAETANWIWGNSDFPLEIKSPKIDIETVRCTIDLAWEAFISHAKSDEVLNITFGEQIDTQEIEKILNQPISNQRIHPLG